MLSIKSGNGSNVTQLSNAFPKSSTRRASTNRCKLKFSSYPKSRTSRISSLISSCRSHSNSRRVKALSGTRVGTFPKSLSNSQQKSLVCSKRKITSRKSIAKCYQGIPSKRTNTSTSNKSDSMAKLYVSSTKREKSYFPT